MSESTVAQRCFWRLSLKARRALRSQGRVPQPARSQHVSRWHRQCPGVAVTPAMSNDDGCGHRKERRPSDWFAYTEKEEGQLESTTSASLKHVLNSAAALGPEHRMPLEYKARVQEGGNNNFPFSSHDNKDVICNAAEYFDLGMGLRKLDPEKRKRNSHDFFEWDGAPGRSSKEGFVTVYQSSFVAGRAPANEERSCRRYPKHHTLKQCSAPNQRCDNPPAEGRQPDKQSQSAKRL